MKFGSYSVPFPALVMTAGVVTIALTFALWPTGLSDSLDIVKSFNLEDSAWQTVKVDAQGRIVRVGTNPVTLGALIGLIGLCVIGVCASAWQLFSGPSKPKAEPATEAASVSRATATPKVTDQMMMKVESAGLKLEGELATVLKLLQMQLGSSERYSNVLDDANSKLPGATSIDQVERIVELLVTENLRVRNEVTKLKRGLETSQTQIENLRLSLHQVEEEGTIDSLTWLKNRRWFDRNGPKQVSQAHEDTANLSLVMADIDNFKLINDTFGHQVGDEVLKRFSELLTTNIKGQDSAVRYGGEEFTLILPNTPLSGARQLTDSIRRTLETKRWMDQKTGRPLGMVTASFGVAQLRDGEVLSELVSRADAKMYEAKRSGKNRVICDE